MPPHDTTSDPEPDDERTDPLVAPALGVKTGRILAGRYELKSQIARGGMAVVYLAEHNDLQRTVAVKILKPPTDIATRYNFAEWFRVEAQTLASFEHPNVVTLHDFGALGPDEYFLVMTYIDGPRLSDLMQDGPMEPRRAARLLGQVCRALKYTHQRGVVHRDIKPSNVMISNDDEGRELVKVIDFGIAQNPHSGGVPAGDLVIGSPHCMSPEQIRGKEVTATADIYSTGVLLFRALTGTWPFHGDTSQETMLAHLKGTAPHLYEAYPEYNGPPILDTVVQRCLQRDPVDRYPNMGELLRELSNITEVDTGVWSTAPHSAPKEPRSKSRTGLLAMVFGLMAILTVIAIGAGWWVTQRPTASGDAIDEPVPEAVVVEDPATRTPPGEAEAEDPPAPEPEDPPALTPEPAPAPSMTPVTKPPPSSTPSPAPAPAPTSEETEVPEGYQGMPDF